MRAVLQRVSRAEVRVRGTSVGAIGAGYVALLGVERGDSATDVAYLVRKVVGLRLFADADGKMNEPLSSRAVLVVSQFTLCADTRHGLRPSFDAAAPPVEAEPLYDAVINGLRAAGVDVATGVFRADMTVELVNDGPVTVMLDSRGKTATLCGA